MPDGAEKRKVAGNILNNAKNGLRGNPKIENCKTADIEDIVNSITKNNYSKDETISFKLYKKTPELLYLNVKAQGKQQHEKEFLKGEGKYFEVGNTCSCNRDITEAELNMILENIRSDKSTSIFMADNCNLDDKSKQGLLKELNSVFKKYDINTCIRKVHFLAQIYHETDQLKTTQEYASGDQYNPGMHNDAIKNGNTEQGDGPKYKGRGLMQLTWKNNYKLYKGYSGEDVVLNYSNVSDQIKLAVDSAGWFWKQGKVLSKSSEWVVPKTSFSEYDKSAGKKFKKTEYNYDDISYATVDMSLLADKDYIDTISWLVNGGGNGRTERRNYLKKLKEIPIFVCENASNSNSEVTIHFVGDSAHEDAVSRSTIRILEEVGEETKNMDIYITSTARTPHDQARIMYGNASRNLQEQRNTYKAPGQAVIDVFENNQKLDRDEVIRLMEAKIIEVGPSNVSKHCADSNTINVFDVSIRRLTNAKEFLTKIRARSEVQTVLDENGAYHIEIPQ